MPFEREIVEVREVLPQAMLEWHISPISLEEAALRLAKQRAREILEANDDTLNHTGDFERMWLEAEYCHALAAYGNLDDEVYLARNAGESPDEIRAWLRHKLKALAAL